jgi:putative ABC transport system permease protein
MAERLLRRLVPGREGEAIAGDLRETYMERGGGRLWYWAQVLTCARVLLSPYRRAIPDLRRDLHYGVRIIRRNPGYAPAAMACLALGIGVNAVVFSLLDGMYFRRLPVPEADRMFAIYRNDAAACSWRDYLAFRSGLGAFQGVAASQARGTFMDVDRANFPIVAETVSANYADVLRIRPALGRWFVAADEARGAEPTVVISSHIWDRYFHKDRGAIGRQVRIENRWYRIIGVAADGFRGVSTPVLVDAWLPLPTFPIFDEQLRDPLSEGPAVNLTARLAKGETPARAAAEIVLWDARLRQTHPRVPRYTTPLMVAQARGIVAPAARGVMRPIALLLLAVVMAVLAIACVNVANLLLARAAVRRREMALRRSLGASRGRLVRQAIAESLILALGGGVLGIGFGYWTDRGLAAWMPESIPQQALRGIDLQMNWRVAAFTALVALVCALLFSLAPAFEGSAVDLRSAAAIRSRQRDVYAIAQVALSLALLVAAGLLVRALERTAHIDPGFATDHRMYIRLFTPQPDFTPESSTLLFTRLLAQARALPGVTDATLSFGVLGFGDSTCASADRVGGRPTPAGINVVEPNYFDVMQVPLMRGRNFPAHEQGPIAGPDSGPLRSIIVNETMARQRWPGQDPVGKIVWLGCREGAPRTAGQVIAVARDSKYRTLDEEPQRLLYISRLQVWWNGFFALIVHSAGEPGALTEPLIRMARAEGSNLRIYEMRTMDDLVILSLWQVRWQAAMLGVLGLLAIVLSVIGLYGVVAYSVAQRTHEIGVRMALGAQKADVEWMVLARGLRLAGIGVAAGLVLSAAGTRFLRAFLHGVDPFDPVAFAGAALAWMAIAMVASYVPALRAARVDPAVSLRWE